MRNLFCTRTTALTAFIAATLFCCLAPSISAADDEWNSAYIGGHAGYGSLDDVGAFDLDGLTGGVYAGYNFQLGNIIVGIEADVTGLEADSTTTLVVDSTPVRVKASVDYLASIRGRIGMSAGPALVYATAGIAWSEAVALASTSTSTASVSTSETDTGYAIGAGAEMKVIPSLSGRAEILHYRFDDDLDFNATTFRAGVTLHFK